MLQTIPTRTKLAYMTDIEGWLTSAEAAEYAGYHPERIRELCRANKLKYIKVGTSYLINTDSLDAFLKERSQFGKPGPRPSTDR